MTKQSASIVARALALAFLASSAGAQAFASGSDGSDGALNATSSTEIALPPDGILNYTTVTVAPGATVTFTRNALNTPVYLLATGDVVISGTIDVRGSAGKEVPPVNGVGGPGGFDGGLPETGAPAGDGHGPGGGRRGRNFGGANPEHVGPGSHATSVVNAPPTYGSALLIPLIGGSGGGGATAGSSDLAGGSGGGGAIAIASSTRIEVNGTINADGACAVNSFNCGSGGAIRLVAPTVASAGNLFARGGLGGSRAGKGRIRVDAIQRGGLAPNADPQPTVSSLLVVFPDVIPRLDVVSLAGEAVAVGSGPVSLVLPSGASRLQDVTIRATGFTGIVPIRLLLVPDNGSRVEVDGQIDMGTGNPADVTLQATFPANTVTHVYAYTR